MASHWNRDHLIASFFPREVSLRSLAVESRIGEDALADLRCRGHDVTVAGPWDLGRVSAVAREDGLLKGAANPRGMQGYAVGR